MSLTPCVQVPLLGFADALVACARFNFVPYDRAAPPEGEGPWHTITAEALAAGGSELSYIEAWALARVQDLAGHPGGLGGDGGGGGRAGGGSEDGEAETFLSVSEALARRAGRADGGMGGKRFNVRGTVLSVSPVLIAAAGHGSGAVTHYFLVEMGDADSGSSGGGSAGVLVLFAERSLLRWYPFLAPGVCCLLRRLRFANFSDGGACLEMCAPKRTAGGAWALGAGQSAPVLPRVSPTPEEAPPLPFPPVLTGQVSSLSSYLLDMPRPCPVLTGCHHLEVGNATLLHGDIYQQAAPPARATAQPFVASKR